MKYVLTDDGDHPLAIVEGQAGVQQKIEELISDKDKRVFNCIEDFRIYDLGQKRIAVIGIEKMD